MKEPLIDDLIASSIQQSPELHVHMLAQACIRRDQRIALLEGQRGCSVPDITDEDFESISILMQENGIGCHSDEDESFRRIVASTWAYVQGANSIPAGRMIDPAHTGGPVNANLFAT